MDSQNECDICIQWETTHYDENNKLLIDVNTMNESQNHYGLVAKKTHTHTQKLDTEDRRVCSL